jgi:predicted component of type VI protein secretion system
MQAITIVWQIKGQQQTYTLIAGRRCVIGRQDQTCDIALPLPTVSRQHATIDLVGETCYLYNISQTNSVYVNEKNRLRKNQSTPLKPGDTFRLGTITFEVRETPRPAPKILKLRCAHCDRIVDYQPEAFCPWCGRALSNAESIITEQ